ncbi:hypothetical protein ERO13_D07G023150v2 [Gossypium hirsutum]|nr:hypothetical protein ERO13_D07G023150v2 [Gossypium hirsutum]
MFVEVLMLILHRRRKSVLDLVLSFDNYYYYLMVSVVLSSSNYYYYMFFLLIIIVSRWCLSCFRLSSINIHDSFLELFSLIRGTPWKHQPWRMDSYLTT